MRSLKDAHGREVQGIPWFLIYRCQLCGHRWRDKKHPIWRTRLHAAPREKYQDAANERLAKDTLYGSWRGALTHRCPGGGYGRALIIGVVPEHFPEEEE